MLLSNLDLLATAPGGVARLRELILTLAVQGKLVPQDAADEPASVLLEKIGAEKERLIAEGKVKRGKPLREISEEEKPFELPRTWEWVRLGATMEMLNGKPFKPTEWLPAVLPIVRIQNLNKASATFNYCDPALVANKNRIDSGSFLISWSGTPGTSFGAFIWQRGAAALNQHIFKCELLGNVFVPEFHRLSINSQLNVLIAQAQGGVGLQHVTKGVLESLVLVLPPLAEQSRIVTRVEELMRLCDALEAKGRLETAQHARLVSTLLATLTDSPNAEALAENWQRVSMHVDLLLDRPEAIDALEQTLLQLAVRGLLVPQDPTDEPASVLLQKIRAEKDRLIATGQIKRDKPLPPITDEEKAFELPVGWEWVRLANIADSRLGKMLDKAKNSGKRYPYLRNTNVQWHHIDLDDIKEISLEASELAEFRLMPGDLLICEGGYPGRCAIWRDPDREMYFQKALHRVRPRGGIAVELIAIALESDSRAGNLDKHFTGATIKHFVGQALDRYVFALPPLTEQSRIVTRVTALRRLCADLRQRLAERQSVQARLAEALVANNAQTSTPREDACHAA